MDGNDESNPLLKGFVFERVLGEDPKTRSAALLGHYESDRNGREDAVVILEKTHFSPTFYRNLGQAFSSSQGQSSKSLESYISLGSNDVYRWILGWMPGGSIQQDAHVKLTLIRPASQAHIAKYSEQLKVMVTETPQMYRDIVKPWIASQSTERIQWVYNILDKKKEADTILYEQQGSNGFIICPDLKWDQKTLSSLYLTAIVNDRSLRSIRDLTKEHIPLLQQIKAQGEKVSKRKYGLIDQTSSMTKLRCFIHYQPTYYHLHVHLLSSDYTSHPGAIVGQAHLLDDVIDLLQIGVDFTQRTFTYSLGEQSQLLHEIRLKTAIS